MHCSTLRSYRRGSAVAATVSNAAASMMAVLATIGLLVSAACASSEQEARATKTPEETVRELYNDETFLQARNAVSAAMLLHFQDRFTPDLMNHFETHNVRVERWLKAHEGEALKLPMREGPIFVSNYEGADTFDVGAAKIQGDRADVPVSLSYSEGGDTARWVDVAMLRLVDGVWRLDDIRFDLNGAGDDTLRKRVALDD